MIADRRVHHFVPGIALALAAGGTSISVRRKALDRWLALPFGAGAALILDEAALLLELDDVYWTEEGVLSLQVSFATIGDAGGDRARRAAAAPRRELGRHHASARIVIPATTTTAPASRRRARRLAEHERRERGGEHHARLPQRRHGRRGRALERRQHQRVGAEDAQPGERDAGVAARRIGAVPPRRCASTAT